jgi:hypothetical protein
MDKFILEKLIKEHKSTREIGSEIKIGQASVRYWLKKYGLKTDYKKVVCCYKCGERDTDKFYGRKKSICGKCQNQNTISRGKEKRKRIIECLGRKCFNPECPGWKYYCSLDIHHLYPNKKDPNFRSMRGWSWKRISREIKNCILLCKNCHAALHNGDLIINKKQLGFVMDI